MCALLWYSKFYTYTCTCTYTSGLGLVSVRVTYHLEAGWSQEEMAVGTRIDFRYFLSLKNNDDKQNKNLPNSSIQEKYHVTLIAFSK